MKLKRMIIFLLVLILCLTAVATLLALPGLAPTSLSIPCWTVDGGGGTSKGGAFSLSGTAGQADAGQMTGGSFTLSGGFWNRETGGIGGGEARQVYLPIVNK